MEAFTKSLKSKLLENYDRHLDHSGIEGNRLASRLAAIAEIGLTEQMGSCRIGFSKEEREAKDLVKGWMEAAGLRVREDDAGNVIGRLSGQKDRLPAILSGSHVDSVPNGGHFDGVLGVLAALEVVEAWKVNDYRPVRPFEVIIFSDEEGSRFNAGLTGSMAMMGETDTKALSSLQDHEGISFMEVISGNGLSAEDFTNAKRDTSECAAYVEVHIEQGMQLVKYGAPVGIVTGIAGEYGLSISLVGESNHAGNTPMYDRQDALAAASEFVLSIERLAREVSSTAVATVGQLNVYPNGSNVIPGEVRLSVDLRDIFQDRLDQFLNLIINEAERIGSSRRIAVTWKETSRADAVPISESIQDLQALSLRTNGLHPVFLPCGAGHDAMVIGKQILTAMFFIRSKDGISHNPEEWSCLSDSIQAVLVLKDFIEHLQQQPLNL